MLDPRPAPLALALCLACPAAAAQTVWTVDDDGGADFTDVQDAVDAAGDGDVILVRDGSYGAVTVVGKSLVIQGEAGARPEIVADFDVAEQALTVNDLAPHQSVRLRGLDVWKQWFYYVDVVGVGGNAGPVVLEDVRITGYGPSGRALDLRDNASVTLIGSTVTCGTGEVSVCCGGIFLGVAAFPGVSSIETDLFVYDSTVTGGGGWFAYEDDTGPGPGQPAIAVRGGSALVSGSTLIGGTAGGTSPVECYAGADGGPALDVDGWTSGEAEVRVLDSELVPGAPSAGACGLPAGSVPPPVSDPDGVVQALPVAARSFAFGSPVEGAATVTAAFTGEPGDLALLVLGAPVAGLLLGPDTGVVAHVGPPLSITPAGFVPGGGTLARDYALPASLAPFAVTAQGAFLASLGVLASGPSTLVALGG